jgi:hypothetical protein
LLEDEEPEPQGRGKFVLITIALLLALGLGYLRWRNLGLDWLTSGLKKPTEIAQGQSGQPAAGPDSQSSSAQNPATPASGSASAAPGAPATTNPTPGQSKVQSPPAGTTPNAAVAPGGREVVPVDSDTGTKPPADSGASPTTDKEPSANPAAASGSPADSTDAANSAPADGANAKNNPSGKASDRRSDSSKNKNEDAENSDDDESAPAAKPAPAVTKPRAGKPVDTVAEGEKYIYGRGVAQDCDRGLRMVRQAANQSNAQAMISLGALYSAGLCAPRDLPTAYRWFAVALRKDPENNSVQTDLKKLWSEMTPPERQLAIKLSQ